MFIVKPLNVQMLGDHIWRNVAEKCVYIGRYISIRIFLISIISIAAGPKDLRSDSNQIDIFFFFFFFFF